MPKNASQGVLLTGIFTPSAFTSAFRITAASPTRKNTIVKGGNVLMISGPQGNSQGVQENQGLHQILDPTHKYTFIGAQPFEVTNWVGAVT